MPDMVGIEGDCQRPRGAKKGAARHGGLAPNSVRSAGALQQFRTLVRLKVGAAVVCAGGDYSRKVSVPASCTHGACSRPHTDANLPAKVPSSFRRSSMP